MSRRRRNFIFAGFVIGAVVLVGAERSGCLHVDQTTTHLSAGENQSDFGKYHGRGFEVVKVVDGDTLDIDVSDEEQKTTRIRLWGVDAPETHNNKMYFGKEASDFVRQVAMGKKVTVYLDEGNDTRGKYGRLLAYVKIPDGRFLNELLLTEGYAYADLRFQHSFYHRYKKLENIACRKGKGLWESVTREQLPDWLRARKPKFLVEKEGNSS